MRNIIYPLIPIVIQSIKIEYFLSMYTLVDFFGFYDL